MLDTLGQTFIAPGHRFVERPVLGTVAVASSYVPTRRAARLNPIDALRTE